MRTGTLLAVDTALEGATGLLLVGAPGILSRLLFAAGSSSGGESHPSALTKPDVKLPPHPASIFQPRVGCRFARDTEGSGLAGRAFRASVSIRPFVVATVCISASPTGRAPR